MALIFVAVGTVLLNLLGITLADFMIAGGSNCFCPVVSKCVLAIFPEYGRTIPTGLVFSFRFQGHRICGEI